MRRSYGINEDYINYLKSLGCVFYLPLGNGDLKDYIGGNDIEFSNSVALNWNDIEDAYKVTIPTTKNLVVATLDFVGELSDFNDVHTTTLASFKKGTTSYAVAPTMIYEGQTDGHPIMYYAQWQGRVFTSDLRSWGNGWYNYAFSRNGVQRVMYENGIVKQTDNNGTLAKPTNHTVTICNDSWVGSSSCVMYMKSIYLFNKVLTADDIKKIQGIL